MTQYIQENLPGIDKEMAIIARREIGEEATQMHLARQFVKYGKWAKFSKDPEFKKRCEQWKLQVAQMMGRQYG